MICSLAEGVLSQYTSVAEEKVSYENFANNLALIDSRNEAEAASGGSGVHGITKFADMPTDEFNAVYLGFNAPTTTTRKLLHLFDSKDKSSPHRQLTTSQFKNWDESYEVGVRDQGANSNSWFVH